MNFNKYNLFFLALANASGVPAVADIYDRISVHPSAPGVIDNTEAGPAAMANQIVDFAFGNAAKPLFLRDLDI